MGSINISSWTSGVNTGASGWYSSVVKHSELVGGWATPLKNISQLGWLFPIYGKIQNVPNHQPVKHRAVFHRTTLWTSIYAAEKIVFHGPVKVMKPGGFKMFYWQNHRSSWSVAERLKLALISRGEVQRSRADPPRPRESDQYQFISLSPPPAPIHVEGLLCSSGAAPSGNDLKSTHGKCEVLQLRLALLICWEEPLDVVVLIWQECSGCSGGRVDQFGIKVINWGVP